MSEHVFKRCGCTETIADHSYASSIGGQPKTRRRQLGATCPALRRSEHGTWWYQIDLPTTTGGPRHRLRRGGFSTAEQARRAAGKVRALVAIPDADDEEGKRAVVELVRRCSKQRGRLPSRTDLQRRYRRGQPLNPTPTVGEWLDHWLRHKTGIRTSTRVGYETHIRLYLKPHLGGIRLDRLRGDHVADMFDAIDERGDLIREARTSRDPRLHDQVKWQRVAGTSTKHRIRAALRSALGAAIAQQLITFNAAAHVELPCGQRPKPRVWTPERVRRWRTTGDRPSPVMVWTPEQTGQFLDHAAEDRLYELFQLMAYRGLRRGEACGLHWTDLDLSANTLSVSGQLLQVRGKIYHGPPKTDAGERTIALDQDTAQVLRQHRTRQHRTRQQKERHAAGSRWADTDLVFTTTLGEPLDPGQVSAHFHRLLADAGLPPIRLHDLRHGAATLMLAAGTDVKTVQETLGHSRYTTTANIYLSVYPTVAHLAAEATVRLVPRQKSQQVAA